MEEINPYQSPVVEPEARRSRVRWSARAVVGLLVFGYCALVSLLIAGFGAMVIVWSSVDLPDPPPRELAITLGPVLIGIGSGGAYAMALATRRQWRKLFPKIETHVSELD